MRYLVTGGAGFIGSHIVETLLKKGLSPQIANSKETKGTDPDIKTNKKVPVPEVRPEDIFVRVLDNFSSGKRENLNFTCDLRPEQKGLSPKDMNGLPLIGRNIEVMNGVSRDRQEYISGIGENLRYAGYA